MEFEMKNQKQNLFLSVTLQSSYDNSKQYDSFIYLNIIIQVVTSLLLS